MVVTFKPPSNGDRDGGASGSNRPEAPQQLSSRRRKSAGGSARVSRSDAGAGIAPVTYLPGARPSERVEQAMQRVAEIAGSDANSATGGVEPRKTRAESRASNVSIHQLARRGMSRWELEQILAKREVDESVAAAELDRLESVGLLDDAALAVSVVYSQHTRKGAGRTAIAAELRRRHIDQQLIDEALAEIEDDDEEQRALELALNRVRQLSSVDDVTAQRRLSAFLARKGYASEVVRHAVTAAMQTRSGKQGGVRFR